MIAGLSHWEAEARAGRVKGARLPIRWPQGETGKFPAFSISVMSGWHGHASRISNALRPRRFRNLSSWLEFSKSVCETLVDRR